MARFRFLLAILGMVFALRAAEPIRVGVLGWTTLNPLLLAQDNDSQLMDLVFDRLVTLDDHSRFVPELLESWDIRQGGREVILHLRPGLTWQDGHPIEAEDLVFTWRMLRLPQVRAINDTVPGVRSMDSLVAEDPLTVRIRLAQPRGSLLSDLYNFIPVSRRLYAVGPRPMEAAINFAPVGSGPYRVVGQASRSRVLLERWDGYRGPHPGTWSGFDFRDISGMKADQIQKAMGDGTFQVCPVASLTHYLVRQGAILGGRFKAYAAASASFTAFFLDCDPKRSLLGDVRLRQALAELLPWKELARGRELFGTRLATSFWPPESWAYDPTPRPLPHLNRARALLEAAGWRMGPDGIRRDSLGHPLSLVAYEASDYGANSVTQLLKHQAAGVGLQITIRAVPFDEVIRRSTLHEGDIWTYGWTTGLDPNDDSPLFTAEGLKSGANVSAYLNPEVDRLFDEGQHTLDPEARKRIYLRIAGILWRDRPVIPLTYNLSRYVADPSLRGMSFNSLGQPFGFWPGMRGWTLAR